MGATFTKHFFDRLWGIKELARQKTDKSLHKPTDGDRFGSSLGSSSCSCSKRCWICRSNKCPYALIDEFDVLPFCKCNMVAHSSCILVWRLSKLDTYNETNCPVCGHKYIDWKELLLPIWYWHTLENRKINILMDVGQKREIVPFTYRVDMNYETLFAYLMGKNNFITLALEIPGTHQVIQFESLARINDILFLGACNQYYKSIA